jgi:CTP:molybdopterin cytidylyltransferase MocA
LSSAVAVILAAGAGRRVGGVAKALLRRADGTTLLEAVVTCARAAGVSGCIVVVGPPHDAVTSAEAARLGVPVAHNPEAHLGMSSSVATGFAHLLADAPDAAGDAPMLGLLWPVDHAAVQPGTVRTIIQACATDGAAVPTYQGRGGHPAGFGRGLWPALATCTGAPQGARSVLHELARTAPDHLVRIAVDDAGVIADIDTPEDRA